MNDQPASTVDCGELSVYKRHPFSIVRGEGYRLWTDDGREFVDFYGGHATALLGYAHPRMIDALKAQSESLFFQTNAVGVDVRTRAARRLAEYAPAPLSRVFFVNSGAEANENALRLACRFTGRDHMVAIRGGFHGRTAAAAACTDAGSQGPPAWYGFPRTPFDVTWVEPNDEDAIVDAVGPRTAAVILEPIQGMGGARVLSNAFLQRARAVTTHHGACLIADEVQCGMGRSGERFAIEASGVEVDLLTTAKGIAGGFPAGAVLLSSAIAQTVKLGDLGTTFGGGPLAASMIETVLDELEAPGRLEHVRSCEREIRARLAGEESVIDVQGRGLLLGIRVSCSAKEALAHLLQRGILAGGARDPHIVRLIPPLTIDLEAIERLAAAWKGMPK